MTNLAHSAEQSKPKADGCSAWDGYSDNPTDAQVIAWYRENLPSAKDEAKVSDESILNMELHRKKHEAKDALHESNQREQREREARERYEYYARIDGHDLPDPFEDQLGTKASNEPVPIVEVCASCGTFWGISFPPCPRCGCIEWRNATREEIEFMHDTDIFVDEKVHKDISDRLGGEAYFKKTSPITGKARTGVFG